MSKKKKRKAFASLSRPELVAEIDRIDLEGSNVAWDQQNQRLQSLEKDLKGVRDLLATLVERLEERDYFGESEEFPKKQDVEEAPKSLWGSFAKGMVIVGAVLVLLQLLFL